MSGVKATVVSREAWLEARKELLKEEKAHARAALALAAKRRALPWVKVEKAYDFVVSGSGKKTSLAGLFAENSDTLVVYHSMFADGSACHLCSFFIDALDSMLEHILPRAAVAVSAYEDVDQLVALAERKGWTTPLVGTKGTTFDADFGVHFADLSEDEKKTAYNYGSSWFSDHAPGLSVFQIDRSDGSVYHTYSTFAAGLVSFNGVFGLLDLTPEGRNEKGNGHMYWVKDREAYPAKNVPSKRKKTTEK
mmetsp:Transcript_8435/g.35256  ORF Transcript_8435/g.35256 Transcript_8435/m.35256 type:complete len:250 (-) Transcript_8435:76-825(-)